MWVFMDALREKINQGHLDIQESLEHYVNTPSEANKDNLFAFAEKQEMLVIEYVAQNIKSLDQAVELAQLKLEQAYDEKKDLQETTAALDEAQLNRIKTYQSLKENIDNNINTLNEMFGKYSSLRGEILEESKSLESYPKTVMRNERLDILNKKKQTIEVLDEVLTRSTEPLLNLRNNLVEKELQVLLNENQKLKDTPSCAVKIKMIEVYEDVLKEASEEVINCAEMSKIRMDYLKKPSMLNFQELEKIKQNFLEFSRTSSGDSSREANNNLRKRTNRPILEH